MAAESPALLFVYGTLLPGLAPALIADVVDTLRIVGPATVRGTLYHLGSYPGGIADPSSDGVIHGQLLELPHPGVLDRFDWYEDFVASDEAGSLFVRRICIAHGADGVERAAWVYCYNRDVSAARRIETGRYHPQAS